MPRNMSFAKTTQQYKNHTKTVTRRNGWDFLKVGDIVNGVNKSMGLKKGEHPEQYGQHIIMSTRREPLIKLIENPEYGKREVIREGFPTWSPREFAEFYCDLNDVDLDYSPNRISFRHLLKWGELPAFPFDLFKCPICEDRIELEEISGMVECEVTGLWIADEIHLDCISSPGIDSDEWDDWFRWHWSLPYVYWLPVEQEIKAWMKSHFRFWEG